MKKISIILLIFLSGLCIGSCTPYTFRQLRCYYCGSTELEEKGEIKMDKLCEEDDDVISIGTWRRDYVCVMRCEKCGKKFIW
jgi:hypothetical protein